MNTPAPRTRAHALLLALPLFFALTGPAARAYETDARVHDPSTVVKSGGTYWVYGTGRGLVQFSSTDRVHWTYQGAVFPTPPDWVGAAVPGNTRNSVWAPDVRFFGGLWHLYYSYSTFGRKVSAIGVATNRTLDPRGWVDAGVVVRSGDGTDFNAIDPCVFQDAAGGVWLSFGSFFSGIKLVPIDPKTGKQAAGGTVRTLAQHPQGQYNSVEASAVIAHGGFYYLFVNWDRCCVRAESTYNIRMGRSKSVAGPYLDRDGRDMKMGGGTLFLGSAFDDGSGRPTDDEVGPGHFGLLHDTDGDWVSFHEEWARDRNGAPTLNLLKLAWDADGWPRPVLDPGPYAIVPRTAAPGPVSLGEDSGHGGARLWGVTDKSDPTWALQFRGDGGYSLIADVSHEALTVAGGSKVTTAPFTGRAGQLWSLRQNDDGTYSLRPKTDPAMALTVTGSLSDGTPVALARATGLPAQGWMLHRR